MNTRGYTLLEVTLFMAISSLLALTAFVGLGPKLRNVRFTDSVRSLEASVNQQFSQISQGTNARSDQVSCQNDGAGLTVVRTAGAAGGAGSQADCILNGVVAHFSQTEVSYRKIVSLRSPSVGCKKEALYENIIQCHKPTIVPDSTEAAVIYSYSNGLKMNDQSAEFSIGFVQDPNGTEKAVFSASGGALSQLPSVKDATGDVLSPCFELGARKASLVFLPSKLQPELNINECGA